MSPSPCIFVGTPLIHCSFLHLSHEIAAFGLSPFVGSGEVSCPQQVGRPSLNSTCLLIWWPSFKVVLGESPSKQVFVIRYPTILVGERGMHSAEEGFAKLVESAAGKCQNDPKWDQMSTLVFLFCQLDSAPPLHRTPCLPQTPGNRVGSCSLEPTAVCAKACISPATIDKAPGRKAEFREALLPLSIPWFPGQWLMATRRPVRIVLIHNFYKYTTHWGTQYRTCTKYFHLGLTLHLLQSKQVCTSVKGHHHKVQNMTWTRGYEIFQVFLNKDSRFPLMNTFSQSLPPSLPLTGMRQAPLTVLARRCIRSEVVNGQTAEIC